MTAVLTASRIALGEHLERKLEMLQAVLLHAGTHGQEPNVDLLTMRYLRWIDELQPEHLDVLRSVDSPDLPVPFDELDSDEQEARRIIYGDLQQRGLLEQGAPEWLTGPDGPDAALVVLGSNAGLTASERQFLAWLAAM